MFNTRLKIKYSLYVEYPTASLMKIRVIVGQKSNFSVRLI